MADAPEVDSKDVTQEQQEEVLPTAEAEEVVSGDGEAVAAESVEAEAAVPESAAPEADGEEPSEAQDKEAEDGVSPKENGDTNGVTASNGGGSDLKRKSLITDSVEVDVSGEKKAKTVEEVDGVAPAAAEEEAEAANGIEAN